MKVPLQVVFEHIAHVDYIEERVRQEAEKLEQFYDHIMSVRAVIARPQHTHHKGDTYSVRLHLTVPGAEDIAVSRDPAVTGRHEDIQVTITDAFDAARRQLQDFVRKRQGHVKAHEIPPRPPRSSNGNAPGTRICKTDCKTRGWSLTSRPPTF